MEDIFKKNADFVVKKLKESLQSIRTGVVTPTLIENIMVETYNGQTKLKLLELAAINTSGPQTLVISPFDPLTIKDIEKALTMANLGASPVTQNNQIFIKFPPLSEEQRQRLAKIVNQVVEESIQKIRSLRDDIRRSIKNSFERKEISEDEKFRREKEIDNLTQEINERIKEIKKKKINEVMGN